MILQAVVLAEEEEVLEMLAGMLQEQILAELAGPGQHLLSLERP